MRRKADNTRSAAVAWRIVCLLSAACFVAGCDEPEVEPEPEKKRKKREHKVTLRSDHVYPLDRIIMNKDGKTLDSVIIGRTEHTVAIERKSDGKRYDLKIHDLHPAERTRMLRLPVVPVAAPLKPEVLRYVEFREREIERFKRKLRDYGFLDPYSEPAYNDRNRAEIIRLRDEILKLENEINAAKESNEVPR